jgi:hypothetical protein
MARPVRVQERLRGWRCRGRLFDGRSREDSRAPLTWGCTRHSSRRGGVLSSHASTASGMLVQWPGWRCDGGDGRTGPMATEVTAPTGLTSWRSPVWAWSSRSSSLRGLRRPFSRCGAPAVREWVAQRHGVVAGRSAHCRTVAGMASPGELAEQCRVVIPRRIVAWICL